MVATLRQRGLLTVPAGGNVIRYLPPLNTFRRRPEVIGRNPAGRPAGRKPEGYFLERRDLAGTRGGIVGNQTVHFFDFLKHDRSALGQVALRGTSGRTC